MIKTSQVKERKTSRDVCGQSPKGQQPKIPVLGRILENTKWGMEVTGRNIVNQSFWKETVKSEQNDCEVKAWGRQCQESIDSRLSDIICPSTLELVKESCQEVPAMSWRSGKLLYILSSFP